MQCHKTICNAMQISLLELGNFIKSMFEKKNIYIYIFLLRIDGGFWGGGERIS